MIITTTGKKPLPDKVLKKKELFFRFDKAPYKYGQVAKD